MGPKLMSPCCNEPKHPSHSCDARLDPAFHSNNGRPGSNRFPKKCQVGPNGRRKESRPEGLNRNFGQSSPGPRFLPTPTKDGYSHLQELCENLGGNASQVIADYFKGDYMPIGHFEHDITKYFLRLCHKEIHKRSHRNGRFIKPAQFRAAVHMAHAQAVSEIIPPSDGEEESSNDLVEDMEVPPVSTQEDSEPMQEQEGTEEVQANVVSQSVSESTVPVVTTVGSDEARQDEEALPNSVAYEATDSTSQSVETKSPTPPEHPTAQPFQSEASAIHNSNSDESTTGANAETSTIHATSSDEPATTADDTLADYERQYGHRDSRQLSSNLDTIKNNVLGDTILEEEENFQDSRQERESNSSQEGASPPRSPTFMSPSQSPSSIDKPIVDDPGIDYAEETPKKPTYQAPPINIDDDEQKILRRKAASGSCRLQRHIPSSLS